MKNVNITNPSQILLSFRRLFANKYWPYFVISILLVTASIAQILPSPPPPSPETFSVFPSPAPIADISPPASGRLTLVSFYPSANSFPPIANTQSALSYTFNRALTNTQITDITVSATPQVFFQKITNTNRKTIYFRPSANWQNDVTYTITLKSPDFDSASVTFTPSLTVDQAEVLSAPEILPKP